MQKGVAAISACSWGGEGRCRWDSVIVWIRNSSQFSAPGLEATTLPERLSPSTASFQYFPPLLIQSSALWLMFGLNEALVLIFRRHIRDFFINKPGSRQGVLKWLYMYFSNSKKWIQCSETLSTWLNCCGWSRHTLFNSQVYLFLAWSLNSTVCRHD